DHVREPLLARHDPGRHRPVGAVQGLMPFPHTVTLGPVPSVTEAGERQRILTVTTQEISGVGARRPALSRRRLRPCDDPSPARTQKIDSDDSAELDSVFSASPSWGGWLSRQAKPGGGVKAS